MSQILQTPDYNYTQLYCKCMTVVYWKQKHCENTESKSTNIKYK